MLPRRRHIVSISYFSFDYLFGVRKVSESSRCVQVFKCVHWILRDGLVGVLWLIFCKCCESWRKTCPRCLCEATCPNLPTHTSGPKPLSILHDTRDLFITDHFYKHSPLTYLMMTGLKTKLSIGQKIFSDKEEGLGRSCQIFCKHFILWLLHPYWQVGTRLWLINPFSYQLCLVTMHLCLALKLFTLIKTTCFACK